MTAPVRDARPPALAVRLLNPVLGTLLRTPLGRMVAPLAVIEFTGRRSGTTHRVVVAWHPVGETPIVLTPAGWRANFVDEAPVSVRWRGRRHAYLGTLDADPDNVAAAINAMLSTGTTARGLALRIDPGHQVDRADVEATGRALIRFRPVDRVLTNGRGATLPRR